VTRVGYQLLETILTKVRKWLYKDNTTRNSGTVWELWGGYVTADHVHVGARHTIPHFADGPINRIAGHIDACLYGCTLPSKRPRDPMEGEQVTVSGYPAGTGHLEHRYASVYLKRPDGPNAGYNVSGWIGKIDQWHPPHKADSTLFDAVYGGMSGGLVSATDGTPLGILITQNGLADLDNDGFNDDSFDFISLAQVWEELQDAPMVA